MRLPTSSRARTSNERAVRLLVLAVPLALATFGCGGSSTTTIIKKTNQPSSGADGQLSVAVDETATLQGEDDCGLIPGYNPDSVLHVYAEGINCDVAIDLAKAARNGTGLDLTRFGGQFPAWIQAASFG
jgi:hypothetical protein